MSKWMPTGFVAYPSQPPLLAETIRSAINEINKGNRVSLKSWEDCKVGGKVVIEELCRSIDQAEIFCADLTDLNANVMFELGYAIATNKRIWLMLDASFSVAKTQFDQLRVLTTIGYAKYCNSSELTTKFYRDEPYADLENTIFEQAIRPNLIPTIGQKILYLKSLHDTEAAIRISQRIEQLRTPETEVIVDDPKESTVQSLTWYGTQVYSSFGVVCHLTSPSRSGAPLHNARYALVSGMAQGMHVRLLMLSEGNFLAPIDYRDLLYHYETASEAVGYLDPWLKDVEQAFYEQRITRHAGMSNVRLATELRGLNLGESIAENEAQPVVNEYFVETAAYRDALEGRHGIFVGRKGAGKTANLLKLDAELKRDKRNLVCVIRPVAYELQGIIELLRKYKQLDAKGYVIESLWKYLLYTEIAQAAADELRKMPSNMLRKEEGVLLQLLDEESGKLTGEFSVRLERCVGALIRSKSAEESIEASRFAVSETLHQGEIGRMRVALGDVLFRKRRVAILIDNLDKAWEKHSDLDELAQFLLGLLSAAARVSTDFKHEDSRRQAVSLSLAIFLRTDIFYKLLSVAREPDKITAFKLEWGDKELLRRVIEERFLAAHKDSVLPEELWAKYCVQQINGVPTKEYFTARILPRPRDLLVFVKAAVATAVNRGQPVVRQSDVLEAEKQYSQYALGSILVENGVTVAKLEEILYEFAGCHAHVSDAEIRGILTKAGRGETNHDKTIDHLCSLSFLGVEVQDGDFRFSEDPSGYRKDAVLSRRLCEHLHRAPRYLIHPAFRTFLEITEH